MKRYSARNAECDDCRLLLAAARSRHHRRSDGEMRCILEAEDQRYRNGRRLPEGQRRQTGAHVADIAISTGEALHRRLGNRIAAQEQPYGEDQRKDDIGRAHAGQDEIGTGKLFHRRARYQLEEERRQRQVDDERVQPAHRLARMVDESRRQVAEKDEAEERQHQTRDFRHDLPRRCRSASRKNA